MVGAYMESWTKFGNIWDIEMRFGQKNSWKTTKFTVAENRAEFEEVRNQQLERKKKRQKTVEKNMWFNINTKRGCSPLYIMNLDNFKIA